MGELWESLGVKPIVIVGGLALSLIAWFLIYQWLDRRADAYTQKWFLDFGCSETTGEFMIVREHKKKGGRQWLSGFWNTILRFKGKGPARVSRHSSSGSRAATSSALHGRVIPPTPSSRSSIERSSSSSAPTS